MTEKFHLPAASPPDRRGSMSRRMGFLTSSLIAQRWVPIKSRCSPVPMTTLAAGSFLQMLPFLPQNYRGPIPLATLHMLFAEHVISARTYVFAEHLSHEREWVRIERVPTLLDALSKPFEQLGENLENLIQEASSLPHACSASANWLAPCSRQSVGPGSGDVDSIVQCPPGYHTPGVADEPLLDEHAPKAVHAPCVATSRVDVTLQPPNVLVTGHKVLMRCWLF